MVLFFGHAVATLFLLSYERKLAAFSNCNHRRHAALEDDIDSRPDHHDDVEQKYGTLLEWLKSMDGTYINEKLKIKPSSRGGGFGAFVFAPSIGDGNEYDNAIPPVVEQDEILFTIPRSACITLNDALHDKDYGEGFKALIEKAGPGGNTVVLAGYMATEWLKCLDTSDAKIGSRYAPYLSTLPWSRGMNSQEHILYWDDEEIESTLKGTMCYGEAIDLRKEMKVAIKVLNTIVGRALSAKENEGTFRLPWERKETAPVTEVNGLAPAVTGGFVSVLTRAFEDDFDIASDQEKMVPLLDMLQHSDQPNVSHFMRKSDGAVEVRAKKPLLHDEEILNQYRSEAEENLPYHRFFTRFGFVPGVQEPIGNLIKDKSSIFFAQKAEI
jgi:SET domain